MNPISLNPYSIARSLEVVAFILVLASTVGQLTVHLTGYSEEYKLLKIVYLDAERNIPTFFSMLLMIIVASLLLAITSMEKVNTGFTGTYWVILACGFLVMAADEVWSFHERLNTPMRKLLGNEELGIFYYAWVIPAITFVLVLGLFFSRFLLHLPAKTRHSFLTAATVYIGGACGIELIGGSLAEASGVRSLSYIAIATLEESMEMAGLIIFIRALLTYIADQYNEVRLRFEDRP